MKFNINEKINSLSKTKKIILIVSMLAILFALFLISTIDRVDKFEYKRFGEVLCTETYINGKLNSTPCPQNTEYFPKDDEPKWILEQDLINLT